MSTVVTGTHFLKSLACTGPLVRFRRWTWKLAGTVFLISPAVLGSANQALADNSMQWMPVYPPALRSGDTIAIVSPAGPPEPERLEVAARRLESLGFKVRLPKLPSRLPMDYLADTDAARADAVMSAFCDCEVDAIFTSTGGYGVTRILDRLDYRAIRNHPKILTGFSDITALHFAIHQRTGLVTFHSPNPTWGLGSDQGMSEFSQRWFWRAIRGSQSLDSDRSVPGYTLVPPWQRESRDPAITTLQPNAVPKPLSDSTRGIACGKLIGGNLTLIASLMGTPFEPDFRDAIVFMEDIGEAPYRIDRMLSTLRLAGKLDQANGFILGRFTRRDSEDTKDEKTTIDEVLEDYFASRRVPIIRDFPVGHVVDNLTLPFGVPCKLDADTTTLTILHEPVVVSSPVLPAPESVD